MSPKPNDLKPDERSILRRDLNNCVRTDGMFDALKVGTITGQVIAAYLLLKHAEYVIDRWDSMLVLFCILTAPRLLLSIIKGKYATPNGDSGPRKVGNAHVAK